MQSAPHDQLRGRHGQVGRITLDRPEAKNALTIEMRDAIVDAVRRPRRRTCGPCSSPAPGDVLRRHGSSASTVAKASEPGYETRSTSEALRIGVQAFIRELWELDKPDDRDVNGAAVGPGAHLALACDFVFVDERTVPLVVREVGPRRRCRAARTSSPASSGCPGPRRW